MVGDSNDDTNFLHKLLLTNTQVSKIRKAFANGSSAYIKLLKTQLSKMVQLRGFDYSLMKNVLIPLAESVLMPLGLTTAAPATNVAIQKKSFGSSMATLIISNEKMDDIMKIVKSMVY